LGTIIHLAVGHVTVDYGQNEFFRDHGALFQDKDLKPVPSHYAGKDWPEGEGIIEMNDGFGKPLWEIRDRLELMGHTLRATEHYFKRLQQFRFPDERPVAFDRLRKLLEQVDVNAFTGKYREDYKAKQLPKRLEKKLSMRSEEHNYYHPGLRPDHWEVDLMLESFDANASLRLLAENEANQDLDVTWDFTPLIGSGYARREQFRAGARPQQQFLIVTEGSSDAKILKHALDLLRPHVADFFRFVDMQEGYPFTGTGNLHRFTQGLISIGVQNKTIILYDNDAEGVSKMKETKRLTLPANVRVIQLPPHEDFRRFKTIGPAGTAHTDINGKAAAIECYLDLRRKGLPSPVVRWTAFNRELERYQGELQHKTQYMKDFLRLRHLDKAYQRRRIDTVLDALIQECVAIAEAERLAAPLEAGTAW
jgi:hypothetical protein